MSGNTSKYASNNFNGSGVAVTVLSNLDNAMQGDDNKVSAIREVVAAAKGESNNPSTNKQSKPQARKSSNMSSGGGKR